DITNVPRDFTSTFFIPGTEKRTKIRQRKKQRTSENSGGGGGWGGCSSGSLVLKRDNERHISGCGRCRNRPLCPAP
ncbi:hypothetical protein GWI33_011821, partial [Rhynchophorus ferrugineus]